MNQDIFIRKNGRKYIQKTCDCCGKEFLARVDSLSIGNGKCCSGSCAAIMQHLRQNKEKRIYAENNPIQWSSRIAYLLGLIASDGSLERNTNRVNFANTDYELIEYVMDITRDFIENSKSKPYPYNPGGNNKTIWQYKVNSYRYRKFLNEVGIINNKTYDAQELNIPDEYFFDFLRGFFDGDGSVTIGYSPTTKNNQVIRTCFAIKSKIFTEWLFKTIRRLTNINGGSVYCNKSDVWKIEFASKKDNKKLYESMYINPPYLKRKKEIYDKYFGENY
jgi:hypothetical protein